MTYILKFGKKFDREFAKIDKSVSEQIVKKLERLEHNPESIGKPLLYTKPALWEFKVESFRTFLNSIISCVCSMFILDLLSFYIFRMVFIGVFLLITKMAI